MGSFFQRKKVRCFLTVFKWCRVTVLLIVLLAVAALAYLQLIGLPDFLKTSLLRTLRQRGFDAQFASARFGWGPSIVIENAAFSPTNQPAGPHLSAEWTQLNLNAEALLRARLQIDSFQIIDAGLRVPISTNSATPLSMTEVNLRVTLGSNNLARLQDGSAWSRGVRIHINGELRNFPALRNWTNPLPSFLAAQPVLGQPQPAPAAHRLTAWEVMQKVHFTGTPELTLHFSADGQDENTLRAELAFNSANTQTPWGEAGPIHLRAVCARLLDSGDKPFGQLRFTAHDITTSWADSRDLSAFIDLSRDAGTNFLADVHLAGHGESVTWSGPLGSNWIRTADLRWDGTTVFLSPTFRPATFTGTLTATQTESGWGSIGASSLVLQTRRMEDLPLPDPAWGQWNKIKTLALDWKAEATNIVTPNLILDRVALQGGWHPPQLTIDKLEAIMYRGHFSGGGNLNVASREVQAHAAVDFDPHQIVPLLTKPAQHWISLYDWESPPTLSAGLRFVLPPWTNHINVWPEESRQSIQLAGDFSVGHGAFRGLAVTSAGSHFTYTNRVWNVSGLRVAGPGGSVDLDYNWSELTHDFHFVFDSKLDPAIAFPLLTETGRRIMSQASFTDKPELKGDVWGNWQTPATTGIAAKLTTGNFVARGESVDQLSAQLDYTNLFLRLRQFTLADKTGHVEVPLATIDFASKIYFMTNASSSIDPEPVRRALGKVAPPFMSEIHFDSPPLVKASGSFIPGDDLGTDMHFFVQGEHFHWHNLTADSAQGKVDYHVRTVNVTNLQAGLYKTGKLKGWINFDWGPRQGTRFSSDCTLNDLNLGAMAKELTSTNSKIEGMLDGRLALETPSEASVTNLFGHGWLHVHNGLLWDIKLFGVFTPILNAIAPGAGNSRAREARASFIITNGVIVTDDLEIRSSGFRLLYRGTVDSQKRLNARVEANMLRDTPLFGHFLGWMLTPLDKLFEYRVTGTLQKPITQPLYIPKVFMEMLRPFHTLKELRALPKPTPAPAPVPTPSTMPPTAPSSVPPASPSPAPSAKQPN
jgi:hypothetical protein